MTCAGSARDSGVWALAQEELLDLARRVVEAGGPQAVVDDRAGLGQGHETSRAQEREVVLDRRLREIELLRDLGQVQVTVAEQSQDPQARLVTERAMQAHDGRRRGE